MEPLEDKEKEEGLHYDRTYEWDSTNDNLGRFIESELLPAVEKQVTPNGNAFESHVIPTIVPLWA
jgi:hypothetical protein